MNKLQEVIYSDAYADIIIPYAYTTPERFFQSNEQYFPQIIDKEYGFLHLPTYMSTTGASTSFFYSLIPNLFVPLDTTSLEEAGIIKAQTQPALMLSGKNILLGLIDTGIQYTHPAFQLPGKTLLYFHGQIFPRFYSLSEREQHQNSDELFLLHFHRR